MFIGRKAEIESLERAYAQSTYQCCMIYGRRRVGKTRLITEFLKGKKHIFLVSTKDTEEELLRLFSESVLKQCPLEGNSYVDSFGTWENLFNYITLIARKEHLIVVIDEFPYLASAVASIASKLQIYCDHDWKDAGLFLILSGSSMSFMEKQIMDYESPLYGRRTMQIKLNPLPYYESIRFFPNWPKEEKLYAYGICGGIPQYLERFSSYKALQDAVKYELLSPNGSLFSEPLALMNEELREPAVYFAIIRTIARGKNKLNEIASVVGKESSQLWVYIANMISLGIIDKSLPIGSNNPKKTIYVIKDNLFKFYFRFASENLWLIENNQSELAYEAIKPYISDYFGHIFEDICKQFLEKMNFSRKLPAIYTKSGSWWGTNNKEKIEEEIDIVLESESNILVAECKWQNEKMGENILSTLKKRGALVMGEKNISYALFSKSGFTAQLSNNKSNDVLLYCIDDLVDL